MVASVVGTKTHLYHFWSSSLVISGKAAEGGPIACISVPMWEMQVQLLASDFGLAQL